MDEPDVVHLSRTEKRADEAEHVLLGNGNNDCVVFIIPRWLLSDVDCAGRSGQNLDGVLLRNGYIVAVPVEGVLPSHSLSPPRAHRRVMHGACMEREFEARETTPAARPGALMRGAPLLETNRKGW